MSYHLEGRLLEVCNCGVLCPCWVGEEPDNGTCDSIVAWRIDRGTIDGVDVSDRTFAILAFLPGTPLAGYWRVVACLDDRATPEQEAAILGVWTGQKTPQEALDAAAARGNQILRQYEQLHAAK